MTAKLSILISYRNRPEHLKNLLAWFQKLPQGLVEAILIEQDEHPSMEEKVKEVKGCKYIFFENSKTFHLSKSLNLGLAECSSPLVAPYDIDLVPWQNTLIKHLQFAIENPTIVLSGYRLMCGFKEINALNVNEAFEQSEVSPSEYPAFLLKRFLGNEKYGVVPMLNTKKLKRLGGWDERFIGWGAEDQELMERYVSNDNLLVRSEELLYLHQHHGFEANWRENEYTQRNRTIFNSERKHKKQSS